VTALVNELGRPTQADRAGPVDYHLIWLWLLVVAGLGGFLMCKGKS
jgi:hypothetical protein